MTLGTMLHTFLCGKLVGKDNAGNMYYTSKKPGHDGKHKRWVVYKQKSDPSQVPAEWHGWLHYRTDVSPAEQPVARYSWQQPHTPNMTGTPQAYFPAGHPVSGGKTPPATGDYEAWLPE